MKKNKKKIKLSNLSKLEMKNVVGGTAVVIESGKGSRPGVDGGCATTETTTSAAGNCG